MKLTDCLVKYGEHGTGRVKVLQTQLTAAGYACGKIDDWFGPKTKAAVNKFKGRKGMSRNGLVTSSMLYELMWSSKMYPRFVKSEFKCPKSCSGYPAKVDEELLILLTKIRNKFGKPVYINSGLRCKTHNASLKGSSPVSQHLYGKATDIYIKGVSPKELYAYACRINPNGGVGIYDWGIHIDSRGKKARFDYRTK